VQGGEHELVVEHISWSDGKRPMTCAVMDFLARWARRRNWRETAQAFHLSWESAYRFVRKGLAQRKQEGTESIGEDAIHWGHGLRANNFLTVIYQIDAECRRLLWIGKPRSQATLGQGLKARGQRW
jgi:transposase